MVILVGLIRPLPAAEGTPAPRAIGVNYFDCFLRTLKDGNDTSYDAGFQELGKRAIPFVRFCATGYWPSDLKLYQTDRMEYFRRMDAVVASAHRHGVGLIPSLFWYVACVPDLVGEPLDQWGNRDSRTHLFMRTYVQEMVTRYRDDPTIWAWEFGNEYHLGASLPNAAEHRPPCHPSLGTPATRSARDDLSYAMIRVAYTAFAEEVRRHDPKRTLITGDAFPRASAWHQEHQGSWGKDDAQQAATALRAATPDAFSMVSVHVYEDDDQRLPGAVIATQALEKTVFVGEFGVPGTTPEAEQHLRRLLQTIVDHDITWAALWVFDFSHQAADYSITTANARAWQLDLITETNRQFRQSVGGTAPLLPLNRINK
jgi:Cellulase (glycosyl hydrolase family 5)